MKVAFLDRHRAIEELIACAVKLCERDPKVVAVGLFGSLARGDATPSSDADILILLKNHPFSRWFDRIPEYAQAFSGTSLPVEVFPYTCEELGRMLQEGSFLNLALREMIPLGGEVTSLKWGSGSRETKRDT